jgi:YjbE family integral membrane protein
MFEFVTADALAALVKVIMIDLVLAGDNAIIIGLAAAGLPAEQRARAILIGILAATLMRIGFASVTTQLLSIFGLLLAGGLLLLWVCWKMWRELREHAHAHALVTTVGINGVSANSDGTMTISGPPKKTFLQATWIIIVADVSMSLDNVLAVAGAAREHPWVLIFGLVLSVALMGAAASYIARLLQKHRWIAYAGLAIILYVALDMIYRGGLEIWPVAKALAGSL